MERHKYLYPTRSLLDIFVIIYIDLIQEFSYKQNGKRTKKESFVLKISVQEADSRSDSTSIR